jgi:hypothetical protein
MEQGTIRKALEAVGKCLSAESPIELLVIGGAAGLLTGELAGTYTTEDVDLLQVLPTGERDRVLDAAAKIGGKMSLPANWLSEDAGLYREALPAGRKDRRVNVGRFGMLQV